MDINKTLDELSKNIKDIFEKITDLTIHDGISDLIDDFFDKLALEIPELFKDWSDWIKDLADTTYRIEYYDPIALDLDGDGVITTLDENNSKGVLFDHDNDGIATATGWIAKQDGILVRDINNNGNIDNGTELFGDNTILQNGQKATNGMTALADLDTNQDGIIDKHDTAFAELKVWQDKNSDGISQQNELTSLTEAGIASINLKDKTTVNQQVTGGIIKEQSTYTKTDGTTAKIADINFKNDAIHSKYLQTVVVSENIAKLPNLKGFGRLADLHQSAMKSPKLAELLENYSKLTTRAEQKQAIHGILIEWAKTDPQYIDNQIEIVNQFTQRWQQDPNSNNVIRIRRGSPIPSYLTDWQIAPKN